MQMWGYCGDCNEWFLCVRRIDGVVADWTCPVCHLRPVAVEQHDVADAPVAELPRRGERTSVSAGHTAA